MQDTLSPNPALGQTKPYAVAQALNQPDVRLSGNEGCAPSTQLMGALGQLEASALREYPSAKPLEARIAAKHEVGADQVIVTSGADDALYRICQAMLGPQRAMFITSPTFEMIPRYARLTGAEVHTHDWEDGPYPIDALVTHLERHPSTHVVAVVSPNNPTGATIDAATLRAIHEATPGHVLILLDHAYVEFAHEDLTALALELGRVVVTRTFSKAWGLAGLRVGYAVGPEQVIQWLRAAGNPYAVSGPSLALVQALFEDAQAANASMDAFVQRARGYREAMAKALTQWGAAVTRSEGNFVFARTPLAPWVSDVFAGLGLGIRTFPDKPHLSDALRISCPTDDAIMARVQGALRALRPQVILFDMDGVLVDVSGSYREAIIQTAAHFGVEITGEHIAQAKAQGDANNDWVLTQRLMALGGQTRGLEEVTQVFERLYQGTPERPGLKATETTLITRQVLEALARHARLGVVTGRPRADAQDFLEREGWDDLFEVVVCMEDGPAKPDPFPVAHAMEQMGASVGWMIGDTPDDIRSARAATRAHPSLHVLPLGVLAPQESGQSHVRDTLLRAGAGRVFDDLHTLDRYLQ